MTKLIKALIWQAFYRNDPEYSLKEPGLDIKYKKAKSKAEQLTRDKEQINSIRANLVATINRQEDELAVFRGEEERQEKLEKFWNTKRTPTIWLYPGRPAPDNPKIRMNVDPRIFFQYDKTLPRIQGGSDSIAQKALDYVNKHIKYTSDSGEYWQFAYETWKRKKGDCEDGAILMANIMLMSGIPYWRIRLNAGDVKGGGHAYVTYLREKDDTWYVMDWCYWYKESKDFGKPWKKAKKYFGIWGSWNKKYVFGDLPKE